MGLAVVLTFELEALSGADAGFWKGGGGGGSG